MLATELIRTDVSALPLNTTVGAAIELFNDAKSTHLPVVDQGKYVGLVSEEQLLELPDELQSIKNLAHMPISVPAEAHLFDALAVFAEYKLSLLPVVGNQEKYLGSLHPQDIVGLLGNLLSSKIPGGVLVLEVNQFDYHLSQIAQIVESNDAKILASFLASNEESSRIQITLRINRVDLSAIVKTFTRYNYTIVATYHKSIHSVDLQARYENLLNYLNM